VSPPSSLASMFAPPFLTKRRHDEAWPQHAAKCRGVCPSESTSFTSAPIARSDSITLMSPSSAAWWRGVAASYYAGVKSTKEGQGWVGKSSLRG
jgi:hypothetical protein